LGSIRWPQGLTEKTSEVGKHEFLMLLLVMQAQF
jgi:hypothetical protein